MSVIISINNVIDVYITLKQFLIVDTNIVCANDKTRKCHFILNFIINNYKKQILIIDIKNNRHYFIYFVLSKKREKLCNDFEFRTYKLTKRQLKKQKKIFKQKNIIMNLSNIKTIEFISHLSICFRICI